MVLDALLVVVVLVCLFVCLFCHCKITAYVGDNKLILILSYSTDMHYDCPLHIILANIKVCNKQVTVPFKYQGRCKHLAVKRVIGCCMQSTTPYIGLSAPFPFSMCRPMCLNQMHHQDGNAKRTGHRISLLPTCSVQLSERAYTILQGVAKTQKCVFKMSENSHCEIRDCHALPGGAIENVWYGYTTTYLRVCNGTKSCFKSESYSFSAHNLTTVVHVLVLIAQICVLLM